MMNKLYQVVDVVKAGGVVAYKVGRVAAIVAVVVLTGVGAYVAFNGEVRDMVIDHAQGQNQVAGLE